ncbi:hypothetical protein NQ317_006336 [Molorchus minor]|uniref:Uncharacterized protein n=1 Tax=Molorchus minor TaxID=1323400 RepID=A0ABQ9IUC5_9CUCU|nr:hypothetical protein NQ317_006336 [Molorchus minor]
MYTFWDICHPVGYADGAAYIPKGVHCSFFLSRRRNIPSNIPLVYSFLKEGIKIYIFSMAFPFLTIEPRHRVSLTLYITIGVTRIPEISESQIFKNELENYLEELPVNEYCQCLMRNKLENYLEELPVKEYVSVIFQQDGAYSHNAHIKIQYLNKRWPARSPDLTPLDFFLWAHLKDQVYITVPENLENLKQRIKVAVNNISPQHIQNAVNGVLRRCQI